MRCFKQHSDTSKALDALRHSAVTSRVGKRLSEGVSAFDVELPDVYLDAPPQNSSTRTKYELEELVKLKGKLFLPNLIEASMREIVGSVLEDHGIRLPELSQKRLFSALYDVRTVCFAVQYEHRRPRPRVVAPHYGVVLPDTYKAYDNTPSYPSARSVQMAFVELYLGDRRPELESSLHELTQQTDHALMCTGCHYRSDIEASHELARQLFTTLKRKPR
jgi:hypothetical protein